MTTLIYNSVPAHLRDTFGVRAPDDAADELNSIYTQLKAVSPGTVFPLPERIAVRRCLAGLLVELIAAVPATLLDDLKSPENDDGAYSDKEFVSFGTVTNDGLKSLIRFNYQVTVASLILQGADILGTIRETGSVQAAAEKISSSLGFPHD